jgi:hypothetical protein
MPLSRLPLSTLLAILLAALPACSRKAPADPAHSLAALLAETPQRHPDLRASIVTVRTSPAAGHSHIATIQATRGETVARFTAFHKDGTWHYLAPVSLLIQGEPQTLYDISPQVSTLAYQAGLRP